LPIVRLSRDKRGNDTVYLIEVATDGRKPGRTRVLYFWTAPPGLRVGRDAFDADRRRAIEAAHPDVQFDWDDLLTSLEQARQQAPPPGALTRRESWRAMRAARRSQRTAEAATDVDSPRPDDAPSRAEASHNGTAASDGPDDEEQASGDDESSEEPARTASRRRRRRRSRRPAGEASSSSADL